MRAFKSWFCAVVLLLCAHVAFARLVREWNLDEETIKLRNMETGQVLKALTNHASAVNCVAFSPDGKTAASSSFDNSDIYNLINRIHCKHILVVLDVCFGGTFGNSMRAGGGADYQTVSKLERIQRAMKVQCRKYITSGGKEFVSDGSGRNSSFAYWLLDALQGGGEEGVLTFEDIYKSVKKNSTSQPVGAAMPTDVPGSDFLMIAKAS